MTMKYYVVVNGNKNSFDSFDSAKRFFNAFIGLSCLYKVELYDNFGALINKNY